MIESKDLIINETTYQRCVRAFSFLHKRLGLNIKQHRAEGTIEAGQIFLFNHFARFEAIIPQHLIFNETGAYCRTLASHEFFRRETGFSKFLLSIGGVPNDMVGLLPFMAAEILRGRKVVVFPEGGMIKDRRVVDASGEFNIFSPSAQQHRKHHKGAAAVAVMLEIFKRRILSVDASGDVARLDRWVEALGLDDRAALLAAAKRPTLIVPANITFFPLRVETNIIKRGAELFFRGLRDEAKEELLIEGNILLKDTDMDIRFGSPLGPDVSWHGWERKLLDWAFAHVDSLEHLFDLNAAPDKWIVRLATAVVGRNTRRLRNRCMAEMYRLVTVNFAHLVSHLILRLVERGAVEIDKDVFHKMIYLAIKFVQREPSIHLHESLADPEAYRDLEAGGCPHFEQFLSFARGTELVADGGERYRFLPKLTEKHAFHKVRLRSPIQVYGNEIAALPAACEAVERALEQSPRVEGQEVARLLFDDALRTHRRRIKAYAEARHLAVNRAETATESGEPYLLVPKSPKALGVLIVHGFLASPAELRPLGDALREQGYPVVGVRLSGHGTSPWDLHERAWQDWMASVERGYKILSGFSQRICVVGASLGGTLALRLAAEAPPGLAGVAVASAPIKLRDKNLIFVPMIHGVNRLAEWTAASEGIKPFRLDDPEHPEINYRHVPFRALFELRRAIDDLEPKLDKITCPAAILQGTEDPVVDCKSAQIIFDKIASVQKRLHWIAARRHGILSENTDGSWQKVFAFVDSLVSGVWEDEDRLEKAEAATPSGAREDSPAVILQGR